MNPLRIGIFMGGRSREREISFAGGRTVFDNLDRTLFAPTPVFVDSFGRLTELDWPYLYKGTIRDFYPPPAAFLPEGPYARSAEHLPDVSDEMQRALQAAVGKPLALEDLPRRFDLAFLTLHGAWGEDGTIQGLLEWLGLPYTGSGVLGSAFGLDKSIQRRRLQDLGYATPRNVLVTWDEFVQAPEGVVQRIQTEVGLPAVVKHPTQGSSIGVAIARNEAEVSPALRRCFFRRLISIEEWRATPDKVAFVQQMLDFREEVGLPATANGQRLHTPEALYEYLEAATADVVLTAEDAPAQVLVEQFIAGTEFSVIVLETPDGAPLALPPTEILKPADVYDYRSKYLAGVSSKRTPIQLPAEQIRHICAAAEGLMRACDFEVYARLDGILSPDGQVFFNDPNTTSGMLPGSFFFHQAAEVGLSPRELLTYIIRRSLQVGSGKITLAAGARPALQRLDALQAAAQHQTAPRLRVGVILGGYSGERHISVESGRNVYEKLSATGDYAPMPLFLLSHKAFSSVERRELGLSDAANFSFWRLPINYLLKDNADDIADNIIRAALDAQTLSPALVEIRAQVACLGPADNGDFTPEHIPLERLKEHIDFAFIALHGRPGEDGTLQALFDLMQIPYNGSGRYSSELTIDKYATNERLRAAGVAVADHQVVRRADWQADAAAFFLNIEQNFAYPLIAKPVDDGCSNAVKKITSRVQLEAYCAALFRREMQVPADVQAVLGLLPKEEMPLKDAVLLEAFLGPQPGSRLLEVTVGVFTEYDSDGALRYIVMEPSEVVAGGAVLSLEEKFLAGAGQNLTPCRFDADPAVNAGLSEFVRAEVERTARIADVEGYARIDAFLRLPADGAPTLYVIEINSLPGLTPATCIFHQAALAELRPVDFLAKIINFGLEKQRRLQRQAASTAL